MVQRYRHPMEVCDDTSEMGLFLSLVFVAIIFVPAGAPCRAPQQDRLAAGAILRRAEHLRGWALFGFPVFAALFSLLVLVISLRRERRPMIWALVAFLCIVATQVVFWTWTYQ